MNPETIKVLRLIDCQRARKISKKTIFDNTVVCASSIKSMFNAYKKSKEFQILQNKVYTLSTKEDEIKTQMHKQSEITSRILCQQHKLSGDDIENLIMIKHFLLPTCQQQLLQQILRQCNELQDLKETLKSYKKILKDPEYIQNRGKYEYVEIKMIKKLLSFNLQHDDFNEIATFIVSLPFLGQQIMIMLAKLFQKAKELSDYASLYKIYSHLSEKRDNENVEIMLKIITTQNLEKIRKLLSLGNQEKFLYLAAKQTKYKIEKLDFSEFTDKTKCLIEFIFLVVQYEPMLWTSIISWTKNLTNQCKIQVQDQVNVLIINIFNQKDKKQRLKVIFHLCQRLMENGEDFIISNRLISEILSKKQENYIVFKQIKKFMAWKTVGECSYEMWKVIFDKSFFYIDIIIEMFNYERSLTFFQMFLEVSETKEFFINFLKELVQKKPSKFIEMFIKIDQSFSGEIFEYNKFSLIQFLATMNNSNIVISIIRSMAEYRPSKYCITILSKFLTTFEGKDEVAIIRTQIIRTINIILISQKPEQLFSEFKKHLRGLSEYLVRANEKDYRQLFKNVPKEMIEELKKYDE